MESPDDVITLSTNQRPSFGHMTGSHVLSECKQRGKLSHLDFQRVITVFFTPLAFLFKSMEATAAHRIMCSLAVQTRLLKDYAGSHNKELQKNILKTCLIHIVLSGRSPIFLPKHNRS